MHRPLRCCDAPRRAVARRSPAPRRRAAAARRARCASVSTAMRAAQRIAIALGRDEIRADHAVRQRRRQRAQFVGAQHVAFDAPAPLHRRLAAQPVQSRRASSASISPPSVRMPRSSPTAAPISFHSAMLRGAERQGVRRRAAVLRRVVVEVVGQQLHVQAAGIGGAGRHAGLVALHQQHVGAVLAPGNTRSTARRARRRSPPRRHAASPAAAPAAGAGAPGGSGAIEQWGVELRRLEHQRCGGHRAQRRARRGEATSRPARRGTAARSSRHRNGPGSGPCRRASPSSVPAARSARRPVQRAAGRR